jgi:hypothetical protein
MTTTEPAQEVPTRWCSKVVTVDALRYTGDNTSAVAKFCRFPGEMGNLRITSITMPGTDGNRRTVKAGDWLVRSPEDGEAYVHSAEQFEAAYEPAQPNQGENR